MPAINKTSLGLNQWLGNEYPKRIDFVEDNKIIDDELIKRVKYTDVATDTTSGIVKFGTETGNAIDAETWKQAIGQSLGRYVSKVESKEAGKWYINDLTDGKIYKCIQTHTSTSFDITKFVDITNVGLSDKVENLFEFGENWIKYPNDLIEQCGESHASNGNDIFNFNIPFKTMNYQIVATDNGPGTHIIGLIKNSTSSFRLYGTNPVELKYKGTGFRWLAIGY